MSNHHGHHHHHSITDNLRVAFWLNFVFTLIELIGGILTNSMAILSDAIHDLGDTVAIGGALFLEKYAQKKSDAQYAYGYKRFSPLAALINSVILLVGSIAIIYETIPRLLAPQSVHVEGMMGLAILGVIMNGLAVIRLKKGNQDSINQRTVMLHLMEDALGWITVFIGSVVMYFVDAPIIDPILSLGIAAYILWNVVKNFKGILVIFLQKVPASIDIAKLTKQLEQIPQVLGIHDLRCWTMDGHFHVGTVHIVVADDATIAVVQSIKQVATQIADGFHIHHFTMEIECESEACKYKSKN